MAKKPASQDWHRADIIAAVRKTGTNLQQLSREHGLGRTTLSNALYGPCPKYERLISEHLGTTAQAIWPSRYHTDGTPKNGRGERGIGRYKAKQANGNTPVKSRNVYQVNRESAPGSLACRAEIAAAVSAALKGLDRYDIATSMIRLLGRDISKHMLDAYTAESREDHIPPLDTAIAFDLATGAHTLVNLYASKVGARVAVGKEALDTKLGQLERIRDDAAKQIKQIKRVMGEAE